MQWLVVLTQLSAHPLAAALELHRVAQQASSYKAKHVKTKSFVLAFIFVLLVDSSPLFVDLAPRLVVVVVEVLHRQLDSISSLVGSLGQH